MLERLIRSKACVKILGVALFQDGLHLREIARQAGVSPYESKRELGILSGLGILKCEKRGNQSIFSADMACPFLSDLRNLYKKTEGVFAELKMALSGSGGVRFAFIFGSSARGEERPRSDIDLLVVGSISDAELAKMIFEVQRKTGREINYIVWSFETLKEKIGNKSPFMKNILRKGLVWLAGDYDEFIRIASQKYGQENRSGQAAKNGVNRITVHNHQEESPAIE